MPKSVAVLESCGEPLSDKRLLAIRYFISIDERNIKMKKLFEILGKTGAQCYFSLTQGSSFFMVHLRLFNLKCTLLHLAGTTNSSWTDRP